MQNLGRYFFFKTYILGAIYPSWVKSFILLVEKLSCTHLVGILTKYLNKIKRVSLDMSA